MILFSKRILLFFCVLYTSVSYCQNIITLGNGTLYNTSYGYPCPYGSGQSYSRHQIIFTKTELNNLGITAGYIYGVGFSVNNVNQSTFSNYSIKMGSTSIPYFTTNIPFYANLNAAYYRLNFTPNTGWNMHVFDTPYYWNGINHLVIETEHVNISPTYNAFVHYHTTNPNLVKYSFGNSGVSNGQVSDKRPNIQFLVTTEPCIPDFTAIDTNTCNGLIHFKDLSTNIPTFWEWDFGDGFFSNEKNPSHQYLDSGIYTVTLKSSNTHDTLSNTKLNFVNYDESPSLPNALCSPNSQSSFLDFGTTFIKFNTIEKLSLGSIVGYEDYTCETTYVYAGHTYDFFALHSHPTFHNCFVWIDWDNDGFFNNTNELIIESFSKTETSSSIHIPSNCVLNTPIRMRIFSDYDLSPIPEPCSAPEFGQIEDYSVFVSQLDTASISKFITNKIYSCDGLIEFTDLSENIPTSWLWDFGDGNFSILKNPTHTYSNSGIYSVKLQTSNQYGSSQITKTNLIEVNYDLNLKPIHCEPITTSPCCNYGIYKVKLNSINNTSEGSIEGYQDFSCTNNTILFTNTNYTFEIETGIYNPQDTKIWIDLNNDGEFDEVLELVFERYNAYSIQSYINIPSTNLTNNFVRMRISSDEVGSLITSCSNNFKGQTEDYGVHIISSDFDDFFLYPNPSNGTSEIISKKSFNAISIYSIQGAFIENITFSSYINTYNLQLQYLSSGMYLVELNFQHNKTTKKLTIQ
jgi:PKD repeat protein